MRRQILIVLGLFLMAVSFIFLANSYDEEGGCIKENVTELSYTLNCGSNDSLHLVYATRQ